MNTMLLLSATLLGSLAFFEPCTIATHSLFAARSYRQPKGICCQGLLLIWLARFGLLALLFGTLTVFAPLRLQPETGALGLLVLGSLYLVSRHRYLPVPHLRFHHLLPGGNRLPDAVRLGLTIPACVLPLLLVVGALVMMADSLTLALIAALLFASLFSLPMAIAAHLGMGNRVRLFFSRAARTAPYLTAALFFLAALVLLLPNALDGETLQASLQQASTAGIAIAFAAGFLFSFNPISFAAIPVVLAYVTRARAPRRALHLGLAFIAGMILIHVVLGVAAALGGDWVRDTMGRYWGLILGPLLILLGLLWPGWLRLRLPWFNLRGRRVAGIWGAFLLGMPFSIAVCPFCAPALLVALTASAAIGSPGFGGLLLLAFALGRSIPILLGAVAMGWLESLRILTRYQRAFEWLGGLVLILTGLYLLNEYFFFF